MLDSTFKRTQMIQVTKAHHKAWSIPLFLVKVTSIPQFMPTKFLKQTSISVSLGLVKPTLRVPPIAIITKRKCQTAPKTIRLTWSEASFTRLTASLQTPQALIRQDLQPTTWRHILKTLWQLRSKSKTKKDQPQRPLISLVGQSRSSSKPPWETKKSTLTVEDLSTISWTRPDQIPRSNSIVVAKKSYLQAPKSS